MGMTNTLIASPPINAKPATRSVQRQCACAGKCERCEKRRLQRKASSPNTPRRAPGVVDEVLTASGRPLDAATRAFMEPRFGQDFSRVRVHSDERATQAARAVHAHAFTVGSDIVFESGRYAPGNPEGRRLLAHELAHVVQQRSASAPHMGLHIDPESSASELEAERISERVTQNSHAPTAPVASVAARQPRAVISRLSAAAPDAASLTNQLGNVPRSGLQFIPNNITDTVVGPPEVRGGLLSSGASRLNVIVAENQTLRTLGVELLPLWLTATPFTSPGAVAPLPLDIISALELAQGLLVYNQTYLPVPAMTRWRAGLRFPLPVRLDETTHVGTLHPLNIRALASGFDPAWLPLLDQRAAASATPPVATVRADGAAFLVATPDALGRGIALGARAVTNATIELPFIREVFAQLGANGFDVALQFMNLLVNHEIELLAAQADGAGILAVIRTALAAAPPTPSASQQADLTRANLMLGRVAGAPAAASPGAMRSRAEKTVSIDTVKLDGSNRDPATDVALANGVLAQCNVRLVHGANATATPAETTTWIGADRVAVTGSCGAASAEERQLMLGANTRFGLGSRLRAFYVLDIGSHARAESYPPFCAVGGAAVIRNMIKVTNTGTGRTLAHEVGHILLNSGAHPAGATNVMSPTNAAPLGETFSDTQCTAIYANA